MELLGKLDGPLFAIVGGVGWVLQTNGHNGATSLGAVVAVAGVVGLIGGVMVWLIGGHQSPWLTSFGHLAPWLARAAILIGLGWVGAWAATEAGADAEGLAVALSVAVLSGIAELVKPLREATDGLRPAAFGKASIQHAYGKRFDVSPDDPRISLINARAAVHDDSARLHDGDGTHTETVAGWQLSARRRRLELIAAGV
jgi:hypothetical protein